MNERIRELAKESGLIQYDSDGKIQDVEKFAILLVAECAMVINKSAGPFTTGPGYLLLEHFGVYGEQAN